MQKGLRFFNSAGIKYMNNPVTVQHLLYSKGELIGGGAVGESKIKLRRPHMRRVVEEISSMTIISQIGQFV